MSISSSNSDYTISDLYSAYEEFIGLGDVDDRYEYENSEINTLSRIFSIASRYIFFIPLLPVLPPFRLGANVEVNKVNMPEHQETEDLSEEEMAQYRLNSKEKIQCHVDRHQLPLKADTSHQLAARNGLNHQGIEKYILSYKEGGFGQTFCDSIDIIPMRDLSLGLISCVKTLNHLLNLDRPYAVGIRKKKSQTWVAELALPFLKKMPSSTFVIGVDSWGESEGEPLKTNIKQFVIFDDATYSGSQLESTITTLKKKIYERFGYERCNLYLVVPFASDHSLTVLKESQFIFDARGNLGTTVITTNKKIKVIGELFCQNMLKVLDLSVNKQSLKWLLRELYNQNNRTKTLTHCHWKLADDQSTLGYLKDHELVAEEVIPPYKTEV